MSFIIPDIYHVLKDIQLYFILLLRQLVAIEDLNII